MSAADLILLLFVALLSHNNSILNFRQRLGFVVGALITMGVVVLEWFTYLLDGAQTVPIAVMYAINAAYFCLNGFVPVVLAISISTDKLYKAGVAFECIVSAVIIVSLPFRGMFYFTENMVYQRGSLYWVYIAGFLVGVIYLLYEAFCMITMFQNKNKASLIVIICCLMGAMALNFILPSVHLSWTCISIVIVMFYGYYNEFWQQIDVLTGMLSQSSFIRKTEQIKSEVTIILFDVDDFKQINDDFGHAIGDRALMEVAGCISAVYGEYGTCFRTGGDEFSVIYRGTEEKEKQLGKEFCALLTERREKFPQLPYVSFGSAKFKNGNDVKYTIVEADASMYLHKDRRKNNRTEENTLYAELREYVGSAPLDKSITEAISRGEFEVWYQPKYDAKTLKLMGAEALVRWRKDDKLVPPGAFIAAFERAGFIHVLDAYVFKTVCASQAKWEEDGLRIVPVSVNLSRISLCQNKAAENYVSMADGAGIEYSMVPIEITETAAVNSALVKKMADELVEKGFALHMDDFGSGYSSLASLGRMKFDTVKVDKTIIDFIGKPNTDNLLRHIIQFAQESGMKVVAEGVEKKYQAEFLKSIGCDGLQGYYFSKPLPSEEYHKLLMEN